MNSSKKSRVLQVKQSTTDHLKGNQIITKFFSPVSKLGSSSAENLVLKSEHKHVQPPRYYEVDGIVVLSDSSDDDAQKDNQENHQILNGGLEDISSASLSSSGSEMKLQTSPATNRRSFQALAGNPKSTYAHNATAVSSSDSRNLFSSMSRYLKGTVRDSVSSAGSMLKKPPGKPHRHSLSNHRPGPLSPRPIKKQTSSPARISKSMSDAKRRQRTLDSYVSPKKPRMESLSSSQGATLRNSQTHSPGISKRTFNTIIDLTQGDSKVLNCADGPRLLKEKNNVKRSTSGSCAVDPSSEKENSSDYLHEMYNLFQSNRTNSASPRSITSISDDENDLPVFNPALVTDSVAGTEKSSSLRSTKYHGRDVNSLTDKTKPEATTYTSTSSVDSTRESQKEAVGKMSKAKRKDDSIAVTSCSETDQSCTSDDEIFCTPEGISLSQTRRVLSKLESEALQPITPRKVKRDKECRKMEFSSDEEEIKSRKQESRKVTYTLNKILKDKKENEELKHMEEKLLEDLKKGGFARMLNSPCSDDDLAENNLDDDVYKKLHKIINSNEDCLGVEETHKKFRIFDRRRIFCFYCRHQVNFDESQSMLFSQKMNTWSRLKFFAHQNEAAYEYLDKCRKDLPANTESCPFKSIFAWLIQILSTHCDNATLNLAHKIFASVTTCSNLKIFSFTSCFYKALCNLGIKEEYLQVEEKWKSNMCKKCQRRKNNFLLTSNLLYILKAFTLCCSKRSDLFDDRELYHLATTFILLAASDDVDLGISRSILNDCLETALNAIQDWHTLMFRIIRYVMEKLDDIHTIHYAITTLPFKTRRAAYLRRTLAYAVLASYIDSSFDLEDLEQNLKESEMQLSRVSKLASSLSISSVRARCEKLKSNASAHEIYNTLWTCTSLLQTCVGTEKIHYSHRTSLESITESLRSLSVSINNNGCLYRSETKFYVGIPIALAEFQLQAFPKSQLYQQGIFKYLSTSRVNEEIVQVEESDDSDDCCEIPSVEEENQNFPENHSIVSENSVSNDDLVTVKIETCPCPLENIPVFTDDRPTCSSWQPKQSDVLPT